MNWEVLINLSCEIGEGPIWDKENDCLYWVDIPRCVIYQYFPQQDKLQSIKTTSMVGALSLRASGGLITAQKDGFVILGDDHQVIQTIAAESGLDTNRFNDGKCDPAGRFWAGTMDMSGRAGAGSLYMLDTDQNISLKIKDVSCSNGLAWSADHKTFYFIDTTTREVTAYDYDFNSGNITNRRVLFTFKEGEGYPDGMTIDSEGMLWIALWNGWKVVRLNPYSRRIIFKFDLPVAKITSCTFGGSNLEDIYITSARSGLSDREMDAQPHAGCVFVIKKSGFKGLDNVAYKG